MAKSRNLGVFLGSQGTKRRAPTVSFEFFPPATPEMAYRLWNSALQLGPLGPKFVSVTYGAGGSTRRRTLDAIAALRRNAALKVAGHLTCVGASRQETLEVARSYKELGVSRIVALRGDPPKDATGGFEPHPDGFDGAVSLVSALASEIGLPIAVGAYPEPHPDARGAEDDVTQLRRKLDAGADLAITQFFFDNDDFFRFRDRCAAAGISAPIVPGVLPIENFKRLCGFAAKCGSKIPLDYHELFRKAEATGTSRLLATALLAEQCDDLIDRGDVDHLHLYTLNAPEIPHDVCRALGVEPSPLAVAASA